MTIASRRAALRTAAAAALFVLAAGCGSAPAPSTAGASSAAAVPSAAPSAAAEPTAGSGIEPPASAESTASVEPTAEPSPAPSAAAAAARSPLANTAWAGSSDNGFGYDMLFDDTGLVIVTEHPTSNTGTATWTESGGTVTVSLANGYATFTGTLQGGSINGTYSNTDGDTNSWTMTKK